MSGVRDVLEGWIRKFMNRMSFRHAEHKVAMRWFQGCERILDVGCGKGAFLELDTERISGIDRNPECVDVAVSLGLNARLGDALDIPYDDNAFDGAYCSHVIHVFTPSQALQLMKELARVVKPGGIVVIVTVPFYERLYFEPADVRPYPPHAIRAMTSPRSSKEKKTITAPTLMDRPVMVQEDIWFRRPALIAFSGPRSPFQDYLAVFANNVQRALFLRKYWSYCGYSIKLRNGPQTQ